MSKLKKILWGSRKRKVVAVIGAVALISGSAFAGWLVSASGTGGARTGSLQAPTITFDLTGPQDVFPTDFGAPSGTLAMIIDNPNNTLYLRSFAIDDDQVTGGSPTCDFSTERNTYLFVGSQVTAAAAAPPAAINGLSIAVPNGVSQVLVPNVIGLTGNTSTECQNQVIAGFTITNAQFDTAP